MRYFKAPSELLNALRLQVMQLEAMPNPKAEQPWNVDITTLALNEHEFAPLKYTALIDYTIVNGGEEITEQEYLSLQPSNQIAPEPCPNIPPFTA